ncbi:GAF domain-containing protein [Klebsiella pneumoniae subsp. pneumoniae]|nr:GAF domain-containing protein [Klebsiella pneumoniae subsp. pneumoniae]
MVHTDRFSRLITTLRQILGCDASARCAMRRISLCRWRSMAWRRMCSVGALPWKDTRGWRRLRAGDVVRFPADSDLPDPYDGLIPGHESLKVHACVGLPLFAGQTLIGALALGRHGCRSFR